MWCILVAEVHQSFPCASHWQRVAIVFDETVDEVNIALGFLCPQDRIFIKCAQWACDIEINQFLNICLLCFVFGIIHGFLQIVNNLGDGFRVKTAHFVNFLYHFTVLFQHLSVKSVRNRSLVVRVFDSLVIVFHFLLRYAFVKVVGWCGDEVLAGSEVHTLGHKRLVENHSIHHFEERGDGLSLS